MKNVNKLKYFILLFIGIIAIISSAIINNKTFNFNFCSINVEPNAQTPKLLFKKKTKDKLQSSCRSDIVVVFSQDGSYSWDKTTDNVQDSYYRPKNGKNIYELLKKLKSEDPNSYWIQALIAAKPDLLIIDYSITRKLKDKKWLLFYGEFNKKKSVWFWNLSKNPKNLDDVDEWEIFDLADKDYNTAISKILSDEDNYDKSSLNKIIDWGLRKEFKKLTIKAILPQGSLAESQTNPEKKEYKVIALKEAFTLNTKGDRPRSFDNLADKLDSLSYLIVADGKWYAWEGKKAQSEGYEPYKMEGGVDESYTLENDKFQAWFRLEHYDYKSFAIRGARDVICYSKIQPPDIYAINNDLLYQPINCNGYVKDIANQLSVSLEKVHIPINQSGPSHIFHKVISNWSKRKEDHYFVTSTEAYGKIGKESDAFDLLTFYTDPIKKKQCLFGWSDNEEGPTSLKCEYCRFLENTDLITQLAAKKLKIYSTCNMDESRWRVAAIEKDNDFYSMKIFEIDKSKRDESVIEVYDMFGELKETENNKDAAGNLYLKLLWEKILDKDRFDILPSNAQCDEWISSSLDNFLTSNFLGKKMNNASKDFCIIQILPQKNYNNPNPKTCLIEIEEESQIKYPNSFNLLNDDTKWMYLIRERERNEIGNPDDSDIKYFNYYSNNEWKEVNWLNSYYEKSAWFCWLSLAKDNIKIITHGSTGYYEFLNSNTIRYAFMSTTDGSLYSWVGNSSENSFPTQYTLINNNDNMFLRHSESNRTYLNSLFTKEATKDEKNFFFENADNIKFKIADYKKIDRDKIVLIYPFQTSDSLLCLSNLSHLERKKISFRVVIKYNNIEEKWRKIKEIYNKQDNTYHELLFYSIYGIGQKKNYLITTYWGSKLKFGINYKVDEGQFVALYTYKDSPPSNFRFRRSAKWDDIDNKLENEYRFVTYNKAEKPTIENCFYSWINDDYRIGSDEDRLFWRANPLGYFDRIK